MTDLTADRLRELIEEGETFAVEFKGEENEALSDADLVEATVCLANGDGGHLLVGVEDDGRVTGARPRHGSTTRAQRLKALISNQTVPSIACQVEIVEFEGVPVVVIDVPPSDVPVGTVRGKYLRRVITGRGEPGCKPFHFHEMQSQRSSRGEADYTTLVAEGATWDDLDPLEFERFRNVIESRGSQADRYLLDLSDKDLAKSLGAVEANHEVVRVRVLGLLLFGREESIREHLPTHEAAFQVIRGTEVEVNEFFRWPLIRLMEELESRYRARNQEREVMVGIYRVSVPDYPEQAFREAVANALVHRDWAALGAVHIQWHPDRLEISNPGGFPHGVNVENILVTPPRPRNPALADAFKRIGLVERTGRGIDTIFREQLRNGRPAPSYSRSDEQRVILQLPGGDANMKFVRLVVEEGREGESLTLDELLVLNQLWKERRLTTASAARLIQKPSAEARSVMERLSERGLVEPRGERKGRTYHLSAAVYRRLEEKEAYTRRKGFEEIQQEQMVINYVEQHGKITRREAANLCRLSGPQAYRLLRKLSDSGPLELVGKGRGAHYRLETHGDGSGGNGTH